MDFFKDLTEWIQALSETENETVVFLLKTVLPISITMFGFFASGLLLAYLIWSPYLKRLHAAREDNLMLTGRLNEIIEDQNILLASLNEVHGAEKEKWHLKIASREDRLQSLNGQLAELDADSSEIRADLASRDGQIESLQREVEEAKKSRAEAISQLEIKEDQIEGLKRDLSPGGALGKRVHELESLLEERDSELEQIHQLHLSATEQHESAVTQLRDSLRERDQQLNEFRETEGGSQELETRIFQLEEDLRQREKKWHIARENAKKQNETTRQKLFEQEQLLGERQREIDSLRDQLSYQGDLRPRVDELESLLRVSEREFQATRDHGNAVKLKLESRIEDLNQLLAAQQNELSVLRNELATVDQLNAKIVDLKNELSSKSREVVKLEAQKTDQSGELSELRRELEKTTAELNQVNGELEAALSLINEPRFQESVVPLPTHQFTVEHEAVTEPVRIGLNSSSQQPDDLKLIKGVGEVMEQKLHEYGVYRFQQIGQWTDSVIEDFTEKLPFGNRVKRDDWVSQARELHREKYGKAV